MNREGTHPTETDERVAENATPSRVTGQAAANEHDDDRSPLDPGMPLDPTGAPPEAP